MLFRSPEGYTLSDPSVNGTITTLTNTHETATTEATVQKVWVDGNDQDGIRPETLVVTLSDGQTVTLNAGNNWQTTVTGLPKFANGEEIVYTWSETDVPEGYTLSDPSVNGTITTHIKLLGNLLSIVIVFLRKWQNSHLIRCEPEGEVTTGVLNQYSAETFK